MHSPPPPPGHRPALSSRAWLLIGAVAAWGCAGQDDPLAHIDEQYTDIMVNLASADRDTTRNVHNREARQRKSKAEAARVAFFHNTKVQATIDEARAFPEGSTVRIKGDAYARQRSLFSPWTAEEKAQETQLLGQLDEMRSNEATWSSADGKVQVPLTTRWAEASRGADELSPEERADLAHQFVDQRMQVVGGELQDLIKLRNEVAVRAGYDNYWSLVLEAEGINQTRVDELIVELSRVVAPINQATADWLSVQATANGCDHSFANQYALRRQSGLDAGKDNADQLFDADLAEDRVMTAFQDMGIPTDGWQIFTGPQRYVRPGVYGYPIHPPQYVAIVMSQDRRWSMWQYEALAHEGGHAVWWKFLDPTHASSPVLWSPQSGWFEGFAQFFERLSYDPAFTARYVPELSAQQRDDLYTWRRRAMAEWVTDTIVQTQVERRLYEDPSNLQAITRFASETRTALTGLPAAPQTSTGLIYDESLLSSILWTYPGYSQAFLYAYLTEAWMYAAVTAQVGDPVANPKVGPLIRDRLVHAPPGTTLDQSLHDLLPGDRSQPLKDYLLGPPAAPTPE